MNNETKEYQASQELREALETKFGQDIIMMDLRNVSTIADFFIIATGGSTPQLQALADTAEEIMKKHKIPLHHIEGIRTGEWVLMDFGSIIVHLFDKESRDFYKLERVWGDANIV
ncbi:MAG: ribosome silencing factor [Defluviitaleaceae bacterium]|nr:ribosome silencing factor [Defluviitaleaceae bacterium]